MGDLEKALKKAEESMNIAEENEEKAYKRGWVTDNYSSAAKYHAVKAVYYQNKAIIKLLKNKGK